MSVLSIDSSSGFELQTQTLVGRSIAVLGITGSGKTNTAAVLIEELLSNDLPLTIVDIEGEYWGLKERFEILVAGRSEHAELEIGPENAGKLAEISLKRGISVILDLSDFTQEESYEFLLEYFKSLWATSSVTRQPYQIVLEEAHEFVPQSTSTPLKQVLTRIALRGRKRGLGIILISQRSAKVEKDVLTQASLLFLHKVVHPIDLRVYKDLIPLPATQVEDMVRRLQPGEAIIIYNHETNIVQLRLRYTFHAGSTPTWKRVTQPKLRKLDAGMLKELRTLTVGTDRRASSNNEQAKLATRVKELEEANALKDAEIQRLQNQIDLLSKLSVSIEGLSKTPQFSDTHTLKVDQAVVGRVITGERSTGAVSKTTGTAVSHLPEPSTSQSGVSLTLAEQRKLDSIIQRFQRLPKLQRSILRLLFEHEGTTMTVPMMASWLSLKESTIRNHPPYDLMKMKLVTRVRGKRGYKYMSSVYSYFQSEFPAIDPDLLLRQIF
jgi:Helicase HerA, central domain